MVMRHTAIQINPTKFILTQWCSLNLNMRFNFFFSKFDSKFNPAQ